MDLFWKVNQYTFLGYVIISSLATASCLSSLFGDFVFDDTEVILNNNDILPDTPIRNVFLHDYWGSSIGHNLSHKSYRPLTILTFRINYLLSGGLKSWSFHLVNIVLHVIISMLIWSVFSKILGKGRNNTAFFGALLFSVHPVHSEAICGIVGRADLLSALFFFLSFLTFTNVGKSKSCISQSWTLISVLLAAISMFCKEQGVTIIGILIIYDILFILKVNFYKLLTSTSYICLKMKSVPDIYNFIIRQGLLVFSAGSLILFRYYLMDFQSPPFQVLDNPASFEKDWLTRVLSYNYIFCLNIWLLLCPEWLCFDWSMGCVPIVNIMDKRVFFVLLFWMVFGFIIWRGLATRNFQKQRDLLMSISLIVIPFLPASNLFFRVGFVLAERILYIPSAGLCLFVVCGIEILTKFFPLNKSDINLGFSLVIMVFLTRSHERGAEWVSEEALFNSGLSVCPLNAKVHYNVAISALSKGNATKAIKEYREAIRLYPDYYQAFNNLANILKNEGQLNEAEILLEKALSINGEFPAAWMNLGVVLAQKKQFQRAEESYLKALKFKKKYPDCYYNLGKLYLEENRLDEADKFWRIAIKLKPTFTLAWNNLIILTSQKGNHRHAVILAEEALKFLPNEPSIYFNMANALGKLGEFSDSERHFLKAIQLKEDNPQFHVNLGVLYHRWKKYRKAEEYYKRALKLKPNFKAAKDNYDLLKKIMKKDQTHE